jgi:hypothetical protein
MSSNEEHVVVYSFQHWDDDQQQMVTSSGMATLECIRSGLGRPILESGRRVSVHAVDRVGRFITAPDGGGT